MGKHLYAYLSDEERQELKARIDRGESKAPALTRARILLLADRNLPRSKQLTYDAIAEVLNTTSERVGVICHKYVEMGLRGALFDKPRPGATPKITGEVEAKLVTLACSNPPEGRKRWTLCLLAEQMVELGYMEDVLDVYARPYNAQQPVVCLDEATKILHSPLRESIPAKTGQTKREDYSYRQHGSANIFVSVEPLAGKRRLHVTDHHAGPDIAEQLRKIVEEDYPKAEKIILVTDNLKSHKPHLIYESFPAEQARAIARKIEWHSTPEHASWLNIAEIELSAFSTQCLNQKIGDKKALQSLADVWTKERNDRCVKVDWQFRTDAARVRLKRLYPTFETRET